MFLLGGATASVTQGKQTAEQLLRSGKALERFGQMVALQGGRIVRCPIADAVGELKTVDPDLFHGVAEVFFR